MVRQHAGMTKNRRWLSLPGPVRFKEGRVIHNGGQQSREAPQQQGGEELGDDGVLQRGREETACYTVQQLLRQPQLQLPLLTLSPQHLRGYCTLARLGTSLMVRLTGPGDD